MSAAQLRKTLIADIERLPAKKLSSIADYVRFVAYGAPGAAVDPDDEDADLYTPESVRAILAGRADYEAGRCVAWDDIKHRYPPAKSKPAKRRVKARAGK